MKLLILAIESGSVAPFVAVLAFGLIVGVGGHVVQSRTMIITGITIIGMASLYFTFVLHGSR